jgi:1-acyl-sn-glycerol-3-phosphate acyltransferase
VAVNSGLYWPRRSFLRYPGTIVFEFLPPIAPGLDSRAFLATLRDAIEAATERLADEARRSGPVAPVGNEAPAKTA